MESSRGRGLPVAPIVFGVIVAVVAVWLVVGAVTERDPEQTVEDYLTALTEKDVEGALALVSRYGYGVPYGDTAAFLTPEAIAADWSVVSVEEVGRDYNSARVKAVIAGPDGTAAGEFAVTEDHDEWLLSDPFVRATFPDSPLSYVRVNDEILARRGDASDFLTYALFPGTYRFYQSVPNVVTTRKAAVVAAFPPPESNRNDTVVVPATMTTGKRVVAQAQKQVDRAIDDCASYATEEPYGNCPFATDGEIDTPDGKRVSGLHGLRWTVKNHPAITLTDDRADEYHPGFAVHADEPGTVTLSGSGTDSDANPTTFTVECDIDLSGFLVTIGAKGEVALTMSANARTTATFNTCRRNA